MKRKLFCLLRPQLEDIQIAWMREIDCFRLVTIWKLKENVWINRIIDFQWSKRNEWKCSTFHSHNTAIELNGQSSIFRSVGYIQERASSKVNCLIKCELNDQFYFTVIAPNLLCSFNKLIKSSYGWNFQKLNTDRLIVSHTFFIKHTFNTQMIMMFWIN